MTRLLLLLLLLLLLPACDETFVLPGSGDVGVSYARPRVSGLKKMQPEQLAELLERSFGVRYRDGARDALLDTNQKLYMGGVDYAGITVRSDVVDPTFSLVMQRLANDYCVQLGASGGPVLGLTPADINSLDEAVVRAALERMYRSVRSRPMDRQLQTDLWGVFSGPELATATGEQRWLSMCTVMFLIEGSIGVY